MELEPKSVQTEKKRENLAVPYTIPEWSGAPCHRYTIEVLKEGSIVDQFDVYEKGAYMFGRVDLCDFVLVHPTISRFHAVLQYKRNGVAYIQDLGSTHGTSVNKNQVKKKVFVELHVGDVIRFGQSTRLYIFQGPSELMPPEKDLKSIKKAKMRVEMEDMEASLLRAKLEAARADGISWGMGEDAIEETEEDVDEITWQTYKGQLTEKQEKTREKVLKRLEKIAHMKKEIDAIRAKDISQGGLTQGQQTQIARNEQRISQIMEELESLEETLNESIRESLGARVGKVFGKKKGIAEDDEEYLSDDDDFYDRTKKKKSNRKGENQSVETADTLLDKKEAIVKEMEEKKELFIQERDKMASGNEGSADAGDELDAYMSGLSSQLVTDKTEKHEKEMSALQSELDKILYLLKIADPMGEAAKKRESKSQDINSNESIALTSPSVKQISSKLTKSEPEKPATLSVENEETLERETETSKKVEREEVVDKTEEKKTIYKVAKPQWLGAVDNTEKIKENKQEAPPQAIDENDQFVDYKDRKIVLKNQDIKKDDVLGIENAAPGLIVRKRKQVEETKDVESEASEKASFSAEDAIALLLKHQKGLYAPEDGEGDVTHDTSAGGNPAKDTKKAKKVLGPEKPTYLKGESEYETWVPPEGQSGDGRTSLNDRFGY